MANNLHITWKQGEVGKEIDFLGLSDRDGLFDLTAWTVVLNAKRSADDSVLVIDAAPVSKRDQAARRGDCYHTLSSTTANIAPGIYKGELKVTNGANTFYWPVNRDNERTHFTIEVQKPLG